MGSALGECSILGGGGVFDPSMNWLLLTDNMQGYIRISQECSAQERRCQQALSYLTPVRYVIPCPTNEAYQACT